MNPINKFHHLIHYPEIIRQNGPSMGYWVMKFEGHHNLYKRISQINCNFRNTPKTVAKHLALAFCANLQDKNAFKDKLISYGPYDSSTFNNPDISCPGATFKKDEEIKTTNWIKIRGWTFFQDTVVVLKRSNTTKSGLPKFGKITKLTVNEKDEPLAVVGTLKPSYFRDTSIHSKLKKTFRLKFNY